MNKITGSRRIAPQDIELIQKWLSKGLSPADVSEITGWSKSVICKIKNGNYEELKQRNRESQRQKAGQLYISDVDDASVVEVSGYTGCELEFDDAVTVVDDVVTVDLNSSVEIEAEPAQESTTDEDSTTTSDTQKLIDLVIYQNNLIEELINMLK